MSTFHDDVNSESDFTGSRVRSEWADIIDSDDDEASWHDPIGLTQLSGLPGGKVDSTPEAGPASAETGLALVPDRKRTPLRSKASSFVPKTSRVPVIGEATCSWVPHSLEQASCIWAPHSLEQASDKSVTHVAYQYGEPTTVIMRNLPCVFSRDDLIEAMDAKGYAGLYNLVYLPMDFQTEKCLGYAFVNLLTEEHMRRFILDFDGFNQWPIQSPKVCSVGLARTQGLISNVERYRNNPVMSADVPDIFRPMLFDGNKRVPFPEPTRDLSKVRHSTI